MILYSKEVTRTTPEGDSKTYIRFFVIVDGEVIYLDPYGKSPKQIGYYRHKLHNEIRKEVK